ncbi:hypothetical protein A6U87_06015 [Rhizobium sp. AC44/96]|nr:hypothetical protein A6U87_06015 [Rhizobium sp. AC44/96]
MDSSLWNKPVLIVIGTTTHWVKNAREAAWLLADQWPVVSGKPFIGALQACAAAIEGRSPAAFARLAFVAAARHANLRVEP